MKKLFIGLLLVAAGAATLMLLNKKKQSLTSTDFQKEQILGKWKLVSLESQKDSSNDLIAGLLLAVKSNLNDYSYEFTKEGLLAFLDADSEISSKGIYEWTANNQLLWKEDSADTVADMFNVSLLTKDSLVLQSTDSAVLQFTKVKQ